MDARRLPGQLYDRSHGEFPVFVQSAERRDHHLPGQSENRHPLFYRAIYRRGNTFDAGLRRSRNVQEFRLTVKMVPRRADLPGVHPDAAATVFLPARKITAKGGLSRSEERRVRKEGR